MPSLALTQDELDASRGLWNMNGSDDYEYVMQRSCFCIPDYIRPGLIQVRSGVIATVQDPETLESLDPQPFLTVDGLFDELQGAIDFPASEIQAQFDDTLGYPTTFSIDFIRAVADDEVFYSARDLRIVAEPGDFDGDGVLTAADIDALTTAIIEVRGGCDDCGEGFDLNQDGMVDAGDHTVWVKQLKQTWIGDANLDAEFESGDLVDVFQMNQYEDGVEGNSTWATGDWNADGDFTTSDLVAAFRDGGFEKGPFVAPAVVPEPPGSTLLFIVLVVLTQVRRRDPVNDEQILIADEAAD